MLHSGVQPQALPDASGPVLRGVFTSGTPLEAESTSAEATETAAGPFLGSRANPARNGRTDGKHQVYLAHGKAMVEQTLLAG